MEKHNPVRTNFIRPPPPRQFNSLCNRDAANLRNVVLLHIFFGGKYPHLTLLIALTQHTLACLTRQGAEALAQRMQAGGTARAERVLVNMLEGKMFVEFRAESREALEGWLKTEGMHFDFVMRIEWEMRGEALQPAD